MGQIIMHRGGTIAMQGTDSSVWRTEWRYGHSSKRRFRMYISGGMIPLTIVILLLI